MLLFFTSAPAGDLTPDDAASQLLPAEVVDLRRFDVRDDLDAEAALTEQLVILQRAEAPKDAEARKDAELPASDPYHVAEKRRTAEFAGKVAGLVALTFALGRFAWLVRVTLWGTPGAVDRDS